MGWTPRFAPEFSALSISQFDSTLDFLFMSMMRWHSWIQLINGINLLIWKSELMLWIQIWIQHPSIIGENISNWIRLGCTCHFQVTQKFTCCIDLDVLRWSYLEWKFRGPGVYLLSPLFLVLEPDLRFKLIGVRLELKVLVDYSFLDFFWDLVV